MYICHCPLRDPNWNKNIVLYCIVLYCIVHVQCDVVNYYRPIGFFIVTYDVCLKWEFPWSCLGRFTRPCIVHTEFWRIVIGKTSWSLSRRFPWIGWKSNATGEWNKWKRTAIICMTKNYIIFSPINEFYETYLYAF